MAADCKAALSLYETGESFHLIMADTSNAAAVRDFSATLKSATRWHATPLVSLAAHKTAGASLGPESTLLDAVSGALTETRGAA